MAAKAEVDPAALAKSLAKHLIASLGAAADVAGERSANGALARGRIYLVARYFAEAAQSFAEALEKDPKMDEAAARLISVRMNQGRYEEALSLAIELASRNPTFEFKENTSDQVVSAMTLLGGALTAVGRTQDAIEAYLVARKSNPKDTFAAGRLAQIYIATGQPKLALQESKAVARNTRYAALARELARGAENALFLPSIRTGELRDLVGVADPGRPVIVEGRARVASLIDGCDAWCSTSDILA